jgi:excisionase family DNA binding protein
MGVRPRVWRTTRLGIATFVRRKEGVVDTGDRLLTPGEVAALFRVDPKTVTRWAAAGRISSIRTPGGHRRFRESEVRALLEGEEGMADESSSQTRSPQPS